MALLASQAAAMVRVEKSWDADPRLSARPVVQTAKMIRTTTVRIPVSVANYAARKHPLQFAVAVASLAAAIYVLFEGLGEGYSLFSVLGTSPAHAQDTKDATFIGAIGFRTFVASVMAIALLWSFGILSWSSTASKITAAKESIRFLCGFLSGLITGIPGK